MKKERNRGRETDRKPNISQIKKTGEHCIYAKRCGGCDYQGILYSQQLSKKQSYMRKLMEPFGKIIKYRRLFPAINADILWQAYMRNIRMTSWM